MNKPIVGITMGDPAGSGPEITIKALADPEQYTYCRPIVVGDVKVFEQARKFVGREDIVIHRCDKVSDALFTPGTIDVLHLDLIEDINKFEMAKVSVEGGKYPSAMLVKELVPGVLEGRDWTYRDSPVMAVSEEDALAYDSTLPPMEKRWQSSQEEFYIMSHSFVD